LTPVPTPAVDSLTPVLPVNTTVDSSASASKTAADSSTQGSDSAPEGEQDANIASRLLAAAITQAQDREGNPSLLPAWLSDAANHLRDASHLPEWAELVDKFVTFEISLNATVRLHPFVLIRTLTSHLGRA
jgi:hypothetical protein